MHHGNHINLNKSAHAGKREMKDPSVQVKYHMQVRFVTYYLLHYFVQVYTDAVIIKINITTMP